MINPQLLRRGSAQAVFADQQRSCRSSSRRVATDEAVDVFCSAARGRRQGGYRSANQESRAPTGTVASGRATPGRAPACETCAGRIVALEGEPRCRSSRGIDGCSKYGERAIRSGLSVRGQPVREYRTARFPIPASTPPARPDLRCDRPFPRRRKKPLLVPADERREPAGVDGFEAILRPLRRSRVRDGSGQPLRSCVRSSHRRNRDGRASRADRHVFVSATAFMPGGHVGVRQGSARSPGPRSRPHDRARFGTMLALRGHPRRLARDDSRHEAQQRSPSVSYRAARVIFVRPR